MFKAAEHFAKEMCVEKLTDIRFVLYEKDEDTIKVNCICSNVLIYQAIMAFSMTIMSLCVIYFHFKRHSEE